MLQHFIILENLFIFSLVTLLTMSISQHSKCT